VNKIEEPRIEAARNEEKKEESNRIIANLQKGIEESEKKDEKNNKVILEKVGKILEHKIQRSMFDVCENNEIFTVREDRSAIFQGFEKADLKKYKAIYILSCMSESKRNMLQEVVSIVKKNTNIAAYYWTNYDCGYYSMGDNEVQIMTQAIKSNSSISSFYFAWGGITDKGVGFVVDIVKECSNISSFGLASNRISDYGFKLVIDVVKSNPNLTSFLLNSSKLTDKKISMIVDAVNHNININSFTLSVSDSEVRIAADAVKNCTHISSFYFYGDISDTGSAIIAEAVKSSTHIFSFAIGSNNITDGGAEILADAIRDCKCLNSFYLTNGRISVRGLRSLSKAVAGNCSVQKMYVYLASYITEKEMNSCLLELQNAGPRLCVKLHCQFSGAMQELTNCLYLNKSKFKKLIFLINAYPLEEIVLGVDAEDLADKLYGYFNK